MSRDLSPRETYVRQVFDAIAQHYDSFNILATGGLLRVWQEALGRQTLLEPGDRALDVCSGTGELAILLARQVGPQGKVVGLDFSRGMLEVAARRLERQPQLACISLAEGNALDLPFDGGEFDAVTMGFALRNIPQISLAIQEMVRVTRPGGRVLILELSRPPSKVVSLPYYLYLFRVLPLAGRLVEKLTGSGQLRPYAYLPRSLIPLPGPGEIADIMREAGLQQVTYSYLTAGIACLHRGVKPGESGATDLATLS